MHKLCKLNEYIKLYPSTKKSWKFELFKRISCVLQKSDITKSVACNFTEIFSKNIFLDVNSGSDWLIVISRPPYFNPILLFIEMQHWHNPVFWFLGEGKAHLCSCLNTLYSWYNTTQSFVAFIILIECVIRFQYCNSNEYCCKRIHILLLNVIYLSFSGFAICYLFRNKLHTCKHSYLAYRGDIFLSFTGGMCLIVIGHGVFTNTVCVPLWLCLISGYRNSVYVSPGCAVTCDVGVWRRLYRGPMNTYRTIPLLLWSTRWYRGGRAAITRGPLATLIQTLQWCAPADCSPLILFSFCFIL